MESATIETPQEPPVDKAVAVRWPLVGLSLAALGALLAAVLAGGGMQEINGIDRVRAGLCLAAIFIGGCGVTIRPSWFMPWFIFGGTLYAASWGFPDAWFSIQGVCRGAALVATVIGILVVVPTLVRRVVLSFMIGFHFLCILMAILSPPPSPWLINHIWIRYLNWWAEDIYMNNAYQFYAPEPGPAHMLWACLEFRREGDSGDDSATARIAREFGLDFAQDKAFQWIKMPARPGDVRDPLALTYYRRLSLTEYTNQFSQTNYNSFPSEAKQIQQRRLTRRDIPFHKSLIETNQFRAPNNFITEMLLPSYARHLAHEYGESHPGWKLHSIRLYRVLHEIVPIERWGRADKPELYSPPYDPTTYFPFFQGEFLPDGKLKDPKDPLLYWVIPIERIPAYKLKERQRQDPAKFCDFGSPDYLDYYEDFLRIHTGSDHWKPFEEKPVKK